MDLHRPRGVRDEAPAVSDGLAPITGPGPAPTRQPDVTVECSPPLGPGLHTVDGPAGRRLSISDSSPYEAGSILSGLTAPADEGRGVADFAAGSGFFVALYH